MAAAKRKRRRRAPAAGSARSAPERAESTGGRERSQDRQTAKPPGLFQQLVALLSRFWHWLVLLVSVIGAAIAGRLVLYGLQTADEAADQGEAMLWYVLAGTVGLIGLVFVREAWLRIVSLRSGR